MAVGSTLAAHRMNGRRGAGVTEGAFGQMMIILAASMQTTSPESCICLIR